MSCSKEHRHQVGECLPCRISTLEAELTESRARVAEWERVYADRCCDVAAAHAATEQMRETLVQELHELKHRIHFGESLNVTDELDRIKENIRALPLPDGAKVLADRDEVIADYRRLTRELDVAINGEAGAAKSPSLCDVTSQVAKVLAERDAEKLTPDDIRGISVCVDDYAETHPLKLVRQLCKLIQLKREASGEKDAQFAKETLESSRLRSELASAHVAIAAAKTALHHGGFPGDNSAVTLHGWAREALAQLNALGGSCVNRIKAEALREAADYMGSASEYAAVDTQWLRVLADELEKKA